jgi:ribosomal protein S18 acetylase RimI-like enzyme
VEWIEAQLLPHTTTENPNVEFGTIFADHTSLRAIFTERDYEFKDYLAYFHYDLAQDIPTPTLPDGYHFLPEMNTLYADKRADVHRNAFAATSRMTPDYYYQFMTTAPMYRHDGDVVVVARDGQFASFAMTWRDEVLKKGEFEPVGTRSELQRKGLGRATMLEGLRRMKAHGMKEASVCTGADQANNIAFYEACGFTRVNTVIRASKKIIT